MNTKIKKSAQIYVYIIQFEKCSSVATTQKHNQSNQPTQMAIVMFCSVHVMIHERKMKDELENKSIILYTSAYRLAGIFKQYIFISQLPECNWHLAFAIDHHAQEI